MRSVQAVFAILFAYLIGVKGGALPENYDANINVNIAATNGPDPCSPNPCLHDGICSIHGENANCECAIGYAGDTCEIGPNPCFQNPCLHGGICSIDGGYADCKCPDGYTGDTCEIGPDPCLPNPCLHGGICVNEEGNAICLCTVGYTGETCEIGACEEDGMKCESNQICTGNFCVCEDGMQWDEKSSMCIDACEDGKLWDEKSSRCLDACEEDGMKCGSNQICTSNACVCEDGMQWDEKSSMCIEICRTNADCQSTKKCLLQDEDGQGSCICKAGRSGDKCEIVDDCMTGKYSKCKYGNGRCSYNDEKETAECDCEGSKKWDNILKICRNICKNDCANSGVCEGVDDGEKFCRCKAGTRGDLCDTVVDCEPQAFGRMLCGFDQDVKCVYDESKKGGACLCDNSTKVFHYDKRKCQVPCKDDCRNSGRCEIVRDSRFCFCKRGTSGDLCERVDDCSRKYFCGTKTNVKCMYDEKKEQATCKCDDPKKAFDFNVKECRIPCTRDCYNNGKCEYVGGSKFCSCKQGTSGDLCEILDDCSANFCGTEPDVKCVYDKMENKATCKCDDPYKSFDSNTKKCRRSTCADYTCQNGGTCNDIDSWPPKCYCKFPFTGERCEKDPCTNNPCKNGGTCQVKDNTYNCICWGNSYGKLCEMDNRFVSLSVLALLALVVLVVFILICNGCFLLKMNQKLNTVSQTFGVYRPPPGML